MPWRDGQDAGDVEPKTRFARTLYDIDDGDGIGIIEAVSQALEQLETEEALEEARMNDEVGGNYQSPRQTKGQESHVYDDADEADVCQTATQGLMTARQVELALSPHKSAPVATNVGEATESTTDRTPLSNTSCEGVDVGPRQRLRFGSRRRWQAQSTASLGGNVPMGVAIFGTKATVPFSKGITNYFATVGSTREKRLTAVCAWGVTVIGLLICLVFVTKDFISSKNQAMVAVQYKLEPVVQLPYVYLCNTQMSFPFFWQRNSGFKGEPTTWVKAFKMPGKQQVEVKFPATHQHSNIEAVTIDRFGMPCSNASLQLADASVFNFAILSQPRCFHCVWVKSSPPISIRKSDLNENTKAGYSGDAAFSIQISSNLIVEACRKARGSFESKPREAAREMILEHLGELQERQILDLSGVSATERVDNDFRLFPSIRRPGGTGPISFQYEDFISADVADMMCNTLLFSGFFYPKPDAQQVKYKYDVASERWVRTGSGPYVPKTLEEWYQLPRLTADGNVVPGQKLGLLATGYQTAETELRDLQYAEKRDIADGSMLRVFVAGSGADSALHQVSLMQYSGADTVFFRRNSINNVTSFKTRSEETTTFTVDGRNVNSNFLIRLVVQDFTTRSVSDQVTVQVTSYLADFFGLIELFLDLSVYTLIISPIVLAMKRRALLSRARSHAAATPISPV